MKKFIPLLLIVVITLALVGVLGVSGNIQEDADMDGNPVDISALFPIIEVPKIPVPELPLPGSLDDLFPPKAPGPVWLFNMLELGEHFTGMAVDLSENDMQNAREDFKKFKDKYKEIRKLVPEWSAFLPMYPVNSLEAALKSGNQTKINAAFSNMGQVCSNCHIVNMPRVQQKFHWKTLDGKDFSVISVKDPQTGMDISFAQVMLAIDAGFVGAGLDVRQGQGDKARMHFQGFNASFQMMKETCKDCHTTERKYYIDASVQSMVDDLGQALHESPINATKIEMLRQGIGMESCFKCHLVHVPAAMAQAREK